jgi:hypothetical protein
MKAFARHSVLAAVWIAGTFLLTACPSQSAGERCDPMNGSADCASGLICSPNGSNVCCDPVDPSCSSSPSGTAGGSGAAGASQGDAAPDGPKESGEAATTEAATPEAATSDGAAMSSEAGAEAGAATPDAADGAIE